MFVYGLIDPQSQIIRYVGLASSVKRPRRHAAFLRKRPPRTHKECWIAQLAEFGLSYEICVLEICPDRETACEAERWWIVYGRLSGWDLTNVLDGGDGGPTFLGRHHTDEAKRRISELMTDVPFTEQHRQALSKAQKLRFTLNPVSEERRQQVSEQMLGNQHAAGVVRRIDILDQRFERLLVIGHLEKSDWICRCDCGTTTVANSYALRKGLVRSCGCLARELAANRSSTMRSSPATITYYNRGSKP